MCELFPTEEPLLFTDQCMSLWLGRIDPFRFFDFASFLAEIAGIGSASFYVRLCELVWREVQSAVVFVAPVVSAHA